MARDWGSPARQIWWSVVGSLVASAAFYLTNQVPLFRLYAIDPPDSTFDPWEKAIFVLQAAVVGGLTIRLARAAPLRPDEDSIGARTFRQFYTGWFWVWVTWCALYCWLTVVALLGEQIATQIGNGAFWSTVAWSTADALNLANGLAFFWCFLVLDKPSVSRSPGSTDTATANRDDAFKRAYQLAFLVGCGCFLLSMADHFGQPLFLNHIGNFSLVLFVALGMAFLFGRLDGIQLRIPRSQLAILYLYALLQLPYALFPSWSRDPEFMRPALFLAALAFKVFLYQLLKQRIEDGSLKDYIEIEAEQWFTTHPRDPVSRLNAGPVSATHGHRWILRGPGRLVLLLLSIGVASLLLLALVVGLGPVENEDLEIARTDLVVDFQQWRTVPDGAVETRVSPMFLDITVAATRASSNVDLYEHEFASSSDLVDISCLTHPFTVHRIGNPVGARDVKSRIVRIDISREVVGRPFEIELRAIIWNTDQVRGWAGRLVRHTEDEFELRIVLPCDVEQFDHHVERVGGFGGHAKIPDAKPRRVGVREIVWNVGTPGRDHLYTIEWDWPRTYREKTHLQQSVAIRPHPASRIH